MNLKNIIFNQKVKVMVLVVLLLLLLIPQIAFAKETTSVNTEAGIPRNAVTHTYEVTLEPEENVSYSDASSRSYYPAETFTFQGTRRGADHYMDGNYMAYEVKIRMADGSTNNSLPVLIQVRKYSGSQVIDNWRTFYPDGITHKVDWIEFIGGGTCYFSYANISDGYISGPVTVTLTTYSWY